MFKFIAGVLVGWFTYRYASVAILADLERLGAFLARITGSAL